MKDKTINNGDITSAASLFLDDLAAIIDYTRDLLDNKPGPMDLQALAATMTIVGRERLFTLQRLAGMETQMDRDLNDLITAIRSKKEKDE